MAYYSRLKITLDTDSKKTRSENKSKAQSFYILLAWLVAHLFGLLSSRYNIYKNS